MRTAFIPAVTGAQSTAIAQALRAASWQVSGSSRSDKDDPESRAADADALILTIPQDHRPGAMLGFVQGWVDIAQRRGVKRIVLNVGGLPGPAEIHPFFADLHAAQNSVAKSGLPFVILQPTVYLDNLAAPWAAEGVAVGVIAYPAPPDAKVSWISHRTLGNWVVAVADGAADGQVLQIGGPQALTGDDLAREIGAGLGRQITYSQLPLADFARGLNAFAGPPAGDRLAAIYEWLSRHPNHMSINPTQADEYEVQLEQARDFAGRVLGKNG